MSETTTLRRSMPPFFAGPEAGVRVLDAGAIRTVVLDRPSKRNALNVPMYRALAAAFSEAADRDGTKVLRLTSAAWPFSVGNDFQDILEGSAGLADGDEFARSAGAFFRALASFPKPIVADVGGVAAGAGAAILLHCDIVIATTTASFVFSSARLGILPDAGSSLLLGARVGVQRATEWLLFGERLDVEVAHRFGIVNRIVTREHLEATARESVEALSMLPEGTVRETKRLLRAPMRLAVEEAITREVDAISVSLRPR